MYYVDCNDDLFLKQKLTRGIENEGNYYRIYMNRAHDFLLPIRNTENKDKTIRSLNEILSCYIINKSNHDFIMSSSPYIVNLGIVSNFGSDYNIIVADFSCFSLDIWNFIFSYPSKVSMSLKKDIYAYGTQLKCNLGLDKYVLFPNGDFYYAGYTMRIDRRSKVCMLSQNGDRLLVYRIDYDNLVLTAFDAGEQYGNPVVIEGFVNEAGNFNFDNSIVLDKSKKLINFIRQGV